MFANKWLFRAVVPAVVLVGALTAGTVRAQVGCASGACAAPCHSCGHQREVCPPPFRHLQEGPVRLHYKYGCPKPVCHPCDLQHYGYYQPCWRPWPFPSDWSHCPGLTPAAAVPENPAHYIVPGGPVAVQPFPVDPQRSQLPAPRKISMNSVSPY